MSMNQIENPFERRVSQDSDDDETLGRRPTSLVCIGPEAARSPFFPPPLLLRPLLLFVPFKTAGSRDDVMQRANRCKGQSPGQRVRVTFLIWARREGTRGKRKEWMKQTARNYSLR